MSYIGSTPTTQSFIAGTDYFNGTGSATAFTLSRSVVSVNDIQATVNNVVQVPNDAYTVSGTTITFTSAPSAGTNNIYVRYLSTTTQSITPSQNTVSYSTLNSDNQSKLGISFKNRIINGAMVINQRAFSGSNTNNTYTLDRWKMNTGLDGKFTLAQSSTAPTGFNNSILITSSSAYSVPSNEYYLIDQLIEGFNTADLNWGTANAKTVTLSFWVRSSLTGTFGGSLNNSDIDRSYPFSYTISAANTWEQKSITVAGDTTGTWVGATNGIGMRIYWSVGTGSTYSGTAGAWAGAAYFSATGATSVVGTSGATWYMTGVQLEVGTQATTFDYRSYGTELALCQRYFNKYFLTGGSGPSGFNDASTKALAFYNYPVTMRTTPSVGTTGTASDYLIRYTLSTANLNAVPSFETGNEQQIRLACTVASGLTAGQGIALIGTNSTIYLSYSAEL